MKDTFFTRTLPLNCLEIDHCFCSAGFFDNSTVVISLDRRPLDALAPFVQLDSVVVLDILGNCRLVPPCFCICGDFWKDVDGDSVVLLTLNNVGLFCNKPPRIFVF